MSPRTGRLIVVLVVFAALPTLLAGAGAQQVTLPNREAGYPPEVRNVTHAPWAPAAGEDVVVTLQMADDARVPNAVSLLFCRVEPDYVCGIPFFMTSEDDGQTWVGTLEWSDRFMTAETVHIGYNLTLRYADPDEPTGVRRVAVPTGNHWVPETYPAESDGTYYFLSYARSGNSEDAPQRGIPLLAAGVVLVLVAVRRGRTTGGRR